MYRENEKPHPPRSYAVMDKNGNAVIFLEHIIYIEVSNGAYGPDLNGKLEIYTALKDPLVYSYSSYESAKEAMETLVKMKIAWDEYKLSRLSTIDF